MAIEGPQLAPGRAQHYCSSLWEDLHTEPNPPCGGNYSVLGFRTHATRVLHDDGWRERLLLQILPLVRFLITFCRWTSLWAEIGLGEDQLEAGGGLLRWGGSAWCAQRGCGQVLGFLRAERPTRSDESHWKSYWDANPLWIHR